jgi:hypothetical protein
MIDHDQALFSPLIGGMAGLLVAICALGVFALVGIVQRVIPDGVLILLGGGALGCLAAWFFRRSLVLPVGVVRGTENVILAMAALLLVNALLSRSSGDFHAPFEAATIALLIAFGFACRRDQAVAGVLAAEIAGVSLVQFIAYRQVVPLLLALVFTVGAVQRLRCPRSGPNRTANR